MAGVAVGTRAEDSGHSPVTSDPSVERLAEDDQLLNLVKTGGGMPTPACFIVGTCIRSKPTHAFRSRPFFHCGKQCPCDPRVTSFGFDPQIFNIPPTATRGSRTQTSN